MRTRIILIALAVLLVAGVAVALALDPADDAGQGGDRVAAGLYPLAFAAEQAGGPELEVENLTPPGAEPHDIEVSPSDVEALRAADLVLLLGRDFQPQLEEAAAEAEGNVLELLELPGLELLEGAGAEDPHVWLDPVRYQRVVRAIAAALGADAHAVAPMLERLTELDRAYLAGLANCERREIVTSHQAFGYLADRYELRQIAISGLSPEAEPSPAQLSEVADQVREAGATTVFSETLLSEKLAETVAREAGVGSAVLNPIEGLTEEERNRGEDYFSLMRQNLIELRTALGCR